MDNDNWKVGVSVGAKADNFNRQQAEYWKKQHEKIVEQDRNTMMRERRRDIYQDIVWSLATFVYVGFWVTAFGYVVYVLNHFITKYW